MVKYNPYLFVPSQLPCKLIFLLGLHFFPSLQVTSGGMEYCWRCEVSANRFAAGVFILWFILCGFAVWFLILHGSCPDDARGTPKALVHAVSVIQCFQSAHSAVPALASGLCKEASEDCRWSLLVRANGKQVDSEARQWRHWILELPLQPHHAACCNSTAGTGDNRVLPVCSLT